MTSTIRGNRIAYSTQSHFHRYRVEVIAQWPESEYKRAALSAARTALIEALAFEQAKIQCLKKRGSDACFSELSSLTRDDEQAQY